jgi:hypothetical protein
MIALQLPFMVAALIPIILLEGVIYAKVVHIPWSPAWRGSFWANIASTFIGIPCAWFVQTVLQMTLDGSVWGLDTPLDRLAAVTLQSAWLVPYEGDLGWMVPAASISLLVPFLLVSVFVERFVLVHYWPESNRLHLTRNVTIANVASYALLAIFWGTQLYIAIR